MEDIDAIARASLDARMPAITARAIARAIAKGVIQESVDTAGKQRNDDAVQFFGSMLIRILSVATERADTRSWLTLPANVQLARLALPPGSYTVKVDLLGANEQVIATQEYPGVVISKDRKTYLTSIRCHNVFSHKEMKMKLSTFTAFSLTLSLLSGCASQPTVPDRIAGDSARYKTAQYLIGRGQAATQEEAKDRARADVAKVFQVAVVVSSEDIQRSKSGSSGAAQYEEQASRHISTRTEQIISGIQIAELWQDPSSGNYHVLAVLRACRLQPACASRSANWTTPPATTSNSRARKQICHEDRRRQPCTGCTAGARAAAEEPASRGRHRTRSGSAVEQRQAQVRPG